MEWECGEVFVASSFQAIRHVFLTGRHWRRRKEEWD